MGSNVMLCRQYLDAEAVAFSSRALDDASVAFKWMKVRFVMLIQKHFSVPNLATQGDVVLIDNLTVMHSRETFVPPRRTLARYVVISQRVL